MDSRVFRPLLVTTGTSAVVTLAAAIANHAAVPMARRFLGGVTNPLGAA
jgi:hypothetical protein